MISLQSNDFSNYSTDNTTLDLTPILDIVFILLIFFMLTSGNVTQSLNISLPENVQQALPTIETSNNIILEVSINSYALDGKKFKRFHKLDELIKNKDFVKNKLIIASDKGVSVEKILEVLTYLQQNGIKNTNILMKNKE